MRRARDLAALTGFALLLVVVSEQILLGQAAYTDCKGDGTGCFADYPCTTSTHICPGSVPAEGKVGARVPFKTCATVSY